MSRVTTVAHPRSFVCPIDACSPGRPTADAHYNPHYPYSLSYRLSVSTRTTSPPWHPRRPRPRHHSSSSDSATPSPATRTGHPRASCVLYSSFLPICSRTARPPSRILPSVWGTWRTTRDDRPTDDISFSASSIASSAVAVRTSTAPPPPIPPPHPNYLSSVSLHRAVIVFSRNSPIRHPLSPLTTSRLYKRKGRLYPGLLFSICQDSTTRPGPDPSYLGYIVYNMWQAGRHRHCRVMRLDGAAIHSARHDASSICSLVSGSAYLSCLLAAALCGRHRHSAIVTARHRSCLCPRIGPPEPGSPSPDHNRPPA